MVTRGKSLRLAGCPRKLPHPTRHALGRPREASTLQGDSHRASAPRPTPFLCPAWEQSSSSSQPFLGRLDKSKDHMRLSRSSVSQRPLEVPGLHKPTLSSEGAAETLHKCPRPSKSPKPCSRQNQRPSHG